MTDIFHNFIPMKNYLSLFVCGLLCLPATAQVTRENVEKDLYVSAGVHHTYIVPETIRDTKAPCGYKAFYVTHYSRHGSRLHTSESFYTDNLPILDELSSKGILTDKGLALKSELEWLREQHSGMAGTLTVRGGLEQQGVAKRLCERVPRIFRQKDAKTVTSRSTNVHRVIQSMANFNVGLSSCRPGLEQSMLTGDKFWDILCYNTSHIVRPEREREEFVKDSLYKAYVALAHPETFFKDLEAVEKLSGVSAYEFEYRLFEASHITGTLDNNEGHNPLAFFPLDDLVEFGKIYNIKNFAWFMHSIEGGNVNEFEVGSRILKDMLRTAEEAIAGNGHCADFRFGHDSGVGPLAGMLEIGDYSKNLHLWESPLEWPAYKNDCMCSNVQLIFYRNRKDDVLVKVLFNENEVLIGKACTSFKGPYYRWEDFKAFIESKL